MATPRVIEIYEPDEARQLRALRILLAIPTAAPTPPPTTPKPAPRPQPSPEPPIAARWSDPFDPIDDATPDDFRPPRRPRRARKGG
ncbi:MAG TPA: hypothetical protein VF916_15310 [Ktedonobacterales bacterium]